MNVPPRPRAIEIQTASHCNAACTICPHPDVAAEYGTKLMDAGLLEHILSQLGGIERIIPYLNNEPFLDPRFPEIVRSIRELYPSSMIEISTNLSPFTEKKRQQITDLAINDFRMSFFGFTKSSYESVMPGLNWERAWRRLEETVHDDAFRRSVGDLSLIMIDHPAASAQEVEAATSYCKQNGIIFHHWGFLDRAGNVDKYTNATWKPKTRGCEQHRPIERMHIDVDGNAILCCQDWRKTQILGNATQQSLADIWWSPEYTAARTAVYDLNTPSPEICKRCKLAL